MKKFFRNNGLSIVFFILFILSLAGQIFAGLDERNEEALEMGGTPVTLAQYLTSGHFLQATFENWESEFLQMSVYLIFSMFLYQKGSSESKDPDKAQEDVDKEPDPKKKDAPWPVKKGGIWLTIYKHSLCYAFGILFIFSFILHLRGSMRDFNDEQILKHLPTETAGEYLSNPRFWFESFQNWQSEFLSIFAIIVFSIFLREHHSPQSKPVDSPDSETGG